MRPDASPSGPGPSQRKIAEQAAAWLSRKDHGFLAIEELEFERWMAVPRQAEEFSRLERLWHDLDRVAADPELAEMARLLDERTRARRPVRVSGLALAAMAAAAAVVAVVWTRPAPHPEPSTPASALAYRVVPSTERLLTLSDGSQVDLRGDSEVSTDFTPGTRRLRLVRGEAHFKVTKNPARPFIVSVGEVAVRAVGTAFDIQFGRKQVEVVVTEGKVTVEDLSTEKAPPAVPLLVAGQRAIITEGGSPGSRPTAVVDSISPSQLEQALAWQSTWLVFDRTPLDKAAEAFNSHNSKRIVLSDPSLANRRLGGMFRADNVDGFVRLLEQGLDVKSERRGENEIILLPAQR